MKIELKELYAGIAAGTIIDVADETAHEMLTKKQAVEVVEKKIDNLEVKKIETVTKAAEAFSDASEYFRATAKSLAGMGTDKRLVSMKVSLGQGEDSTAAGGGLVAHPIWGTEIWNSIKTEAQIAPKCREIKLSTPMMNGIRIPQINAPTLTAAAGLFGGVKVYAVAEAGTTTPSAAAYAQKDVSLNKLAAIIPATREILQDVSAFKTLVYDQLREALAWYLDESVLINTLGVMTQGIVGATATRAVTIAGAVPTAEELAKFWISVAPMSRQKGEWYMSNSMFGSLLTIKSTPYDANATGVAATLPMFMPSFVPGTPNMLFGRPINIITQAGADGTPASLCFLDLADYAVVSREDVIEDSNVSLYYLSDQELFRILLRVSGAPLRATKVTLADSTVVSSLVTRAQL